MILAFCRSVKPFTLINGITKRSIYVLGIETSYDDTSAAVVDDSGKILGRSDFSQSKIIAEAGGLVGSVSSSIHRHLIKTTVDNALNQSSLTCKDMDAIAVTVKPGFESSLLVGVEYAKDLSKLYRKPLIPIHHMEAHALTIRMIEDVKFPFLVFLMSGGHCLLAIAESVSKFYTLGEALDGTPGQAFDKLAVRAKLKNLKNYRKITGGAAVEQVALEGDPTKYRYNDFVVPGKHCNFSFKGLKTTAYNYIRRQEESLDLAPDSVIPDVADICAGFQTAMTVLFCRRLEVAINYIIEKNLFTSEKCMVLSGGVASNMYIRNALSLICDKYEYKMKVPPPNLCTDNGVMIAWNGIERLKENLPVIQPDNLESVSVLPTAPLGENISEEVTTCAKSMDFKYLKIQNILTEKFRQKQDEIVA